MHEVQSSGDRLHQRCISSSMGIDVVWNVVQYFKDTGRRIRSQ